MKIAFLTEHFTPKIDGVVTRLSHTIKHLNQNGIDTIVLTSSNQANFKSRMDLVNGTKVYRLLSINVSKEKKLVIPNKSISNILLNYKPDIIHVLNPMFLGYYGLRFAEKYSIPIVASQHTNYAEYFKYYHVGFLKHFFWRYIKTTLNRANLCLCTSTQMHNLLKQMGILNPVIWQPGVDIDSFKPALNHPFLPKNPLLIYVGRLAAEKNIELVKSALLANPQIHFAIIGEGIHKKKLVNHFSGTNTHFLGLLQGKKLAEAYASADALILPSSTETLGLVILEAMAAGIPVLGADAGGIPDLIAHGKNGYLFAPNCDNALSRAVSLAFQCDTTTWNEMKIIARATAEKWSWKNATLQLISLYQNLLRSHAKIW